MTLSDDERRRLELAERRAAREHRARLAAEQVGERATRELYDALQEAERARRRSDALLSSAGDGIYGIDQDGRVTFVNPAAERILGWTADELIGADMHALIHHSHADGTPIPDGACPVGRTLRDGELVTVEDDTFWRRDGQPLPVAYNAAPMRDEDAVIGAIVVVRDLSTARRAEQMRRHAEDMERHAREQEQIARLGVAALRSTDRFEAMDAAVRTLTEVLAVPYATILERVTPDRVVVRAISDPALSGSIGASYELRPDWHVGYTLERDEPVVVEDFTAETRFGRPTFPRDERIRSGIAVGIPGAAGVWGTIGVHDRVPRSFTTRDVHLVQSVANIVATAIARGSLERALADESERLRVTLHSIGDGVAVTDLRGRVTMLNRVAEELTGWSAADAAGQPLSDVFRVVDETTREPRPDPVQEVLRTGAVVDPASGTLLMSRDGREYLIAHSAAPLRDRNDQIGGTVLVFRDITEDLRVERDLQRASKLEAIGVLAGGIAHDFNNVLTIVLSNLALASRRSSEEQVRERIAEAERACRRAQHLTQQLLTFARGGAPMKEAVELGHRIRETADLTCRGTPSRCEVRLDPELHAVLGDPAQIDQVIQNLVLNAIQAMPGGGLVRIEAHNATIPPPELPVRAGSYVVLEVADSGPGVAPEHIPKLFDPFFTTKPTGTGLGLATVYSIVRRHEGHVSVESPKGSGAVFTVYLPATETAPSTPADEPQPVRRLEGRILFMDDEPHLGRIVADALRELGADVVATTDGAEAVTRYLEAVESGQPFELVLLDLTVPGGMGGVETLERLRAIDPSVRAIASSGYFNDPVMANHREHGFVDALSKPYGLEELAARVAAAMCRSDD